MSVSKNYIYIYFALANLQKKRNLSKKKKKFQRKIPKDLQCEYIAMHDFTTC